MNDDKFILEDVEYTPLHQARELGCKCCSIKGRGLAACVRADAAAGRDCEAESLIYVALRGGSE